MTLFIARQIVLAARPQGTPQLTDFRLEETAIPTPAAGQLLLGVQYLSLDPYMRGRMDDRKSYVTPPSSARSCRVTRWRRCSPHTIPRKRKATLSSHQRDGARTGSRMAPAGARLIQPWRRSRPVSACSVCPGSRRMPVCA